MLCARGSWLLAAGPVLGAHGVVLVVQVGAHGLSGSFRRSSAWARSCGWSAHGGSVVLRVVVHPSKRPDIASVVHRLLFQARSSAPVARLWRPAPASEVFAIV